VALTLTEAQRLLLGIIISVESGVTTPEEAVDELNELNTRAETANLNFKADYTLADFEEIRADYLSNYYEYDYAGDDYDNAIGDDNEE
jgi:hypothetical protein